MKIGYFIHSGNLKAGGIFTYSIGILKLLIKSDQIERIVLIYSDSSEEYLKSLIDSSKLEFLKINRDAGFNKLRYSIAYFLFDLYEIYSGYLSNPDKLKFLKSISNFINPFRKIEKLKIDLFHVPVQYSPIYNIKIPILFTMHDVQEFHYPEFFNAKERLHRSLNSLKSIGNAEQVIVSFDHIKNDLQKIFGLTENKITVCPPPIASNWFAKENYADIKTLQDKYSISPKFILYPAAVWKHKNHKFLLGAFKNICSKNSDVELICTGNNNTDYFPNVQKELNALSLNDKVKFLGMVPDEDLIGLYKATSLVVIPTLYEAGSGPLYEAMRFGAPVICARTTSLPETMNNDEFTFDPREIKELENLLEKGLNDSNFINQNLKNSIKRIEFYKDQDYITNFLIAYKKAIAAKSVATA